MKSSSEIWVCKSEEDVLVYDPSVQTERPEYIQLWNVATSTFSRYRVAVFRGWIEKADGPTKAKARAAYETWAAANRQKEREALILRHEQFLAERGLQNRGVRGATRTTEHRTTHCYACKTPLDSWVDTECVSCSWIICSCGACGCGYGTL